MMVESSGKKGYKTLPEMRAALAAAEAAAVQPVEGLSISPDLMGFDELQLLLESQGGGSAEAPPPHNDEDLAEELEV
jgi:hypothetical protein